jgi:hypothetical protein
MAIMMMNNIEYIYIALALVVDDYSKMFHLFIYNKYTSSITKY